MKIKLLISITFFVCKLSAQDTLTMLQYNLLHYGNYTDYCTPSNNNVSTKDGYIRTIINYVKPDVFCVNEISDSEVIHKHMLDSILNVNGIDYYRKADFIQVADSYIANMMYYNSEKLALQSHTIAQSYIRDIDVYKLYYRSNDLDQGDTAHLICVVSHLKSSGGDQNENKRRVMVNNAMNYLNEYDNNANYMFMGDFNVYESDEPAYQLLINNPNSEILFLDPLNSPGDWHNNYTYRNIHTQSTHSDQNGCASYGGMDDRFDFILLSDNIMYGHKDVRYIDGSYEAIGQDGLHFNKSINDEPLNQSAPAEVIDALYGNSDHLPIQIKVIIDKTLGVNNHQSLQFDKIYFNNYVEEILKLQFNSKKETSLNLQIVSASGTVVYECRNEVAPGENEIEYNLSRLSQGVYIAIFTNEHTGSVTRKIVKM
jgi:type IX secretion system substrate protein